MKFRNLVFLFIVALILVAWFTKPDYDDFMVFREEQASDLHGPPVVDYTDGFLFSQVKVTHFQALEKPAVDSTGQTQTLAVPSQTEKYIGLFGRFWSID